MVNQIIYVQLLEEGSIAYRPVTATRLNDLYYKIDGKEVFDTDDEIWEFLPGMIVKVNESITSEGYKVLIATEEVLNNINE